MRLTTRNTTLAAVLATALVPVLAHEKQTTPTSREGVHARMLELADQMEALQTEGASDFALQPLQREYARLSAALGGDDPARTNQIGTPLPGQIGLVAVPPACGATPVTASFPGTGGPLGTPAVASTFTTLVSGLDPYLWDVNLTTAITHPGCADLDITLTSPAGTVVTITTDNGGTLDNVFNGTLFDDNVNDPVTDKAFTNNVASTPLSPEGRLSAFRGENPNGTWTLSILDDLVANVGALNSWSIDIRTLSAAPTPASMSFMTSPGVGVGPGASTVNSTQLVSGLGTYLSEVEVAINVTHTFAADLDIFLVSPAGTTVNLTTDNGGGFDNTFAGSLFDADAPIPVTDRVYANLVVATPLSSEGSVDNFLGQDPNGTWTLRVVDDASPDAGVLVSWTLSITTIPAPTPSAPANFVGTTGAIPDAGGSVSLGTFTFTATASGLPAYLWDVDLAMTLTHEQADNLDITLTSPAGTTVTLTTDNGGTFDNLFNGTLFDDNVNAPTTDFTYVNNVAPAALSPEGRLAAFRGENPNGVWTLTVVDDAAANVGNLASWNLALAALSAAPSEVSTTLTRMPALPIPDVATTNDTVAAAGLGTSITEIELRLEILHTFTADMDISLISPAGTTVAVSTDNGGGNDNSFNGTLFDPDAPLTVTDIAYPTNATVPLVSPEGSFDNFLGQDPNGTWRLQIVDDLGGDSGTLVRWDLTIRTCGAPGPVVFCPGDGSGTACPCGNNSTPGAGEGCLNSFGQGAKLVVTGSTSLSNDTAVLSGTQMPSAPCLYFQGTGQAAGGLGVVFGDGLRCAAGTVVRLKQIQNVGGASQYPEAGDPPVSVRGLIGAPGTRTYQIWYRNNAVFCTPDGWNLSNGVQVTWSM